MGAVNVHPIEFIIGEFMHVFAMWFVASFCCRVHVATICLFMIVGGVVASLNHSRFDVIWPGVVGVRYHDIHHSVYPFNLNYSQYTILWDRLYGTFLHSKQDLVKK